MLRLEGLLPHVRFAILVTLITVLAACGDDGGGTSSPPPDAGQDVVEDTPDVADVQDVAEEVDTAPDVPDVEDEPDVPEQVCQPLETRCDGTAARERCTVDGLMWEREECAAESICEEGVCRPRICQPNTPTGCLDGGTLLICNDSGTESVENPCTAPEMCRFIDGEFRCTERVCSQDEQRCLSQTEVERCNDDGSGFEPAEACEGEFICLDNACRTLCEVIEDDKTFLGCEYWSVDLPNQGGAEPAAHAVVVSNPHESLSAVVTVERGDGTELDIAEWDNVVPPGEQRVFSFDPSYVDATTGDDLIDPYYVSGTLIGDQAFKVTSSIPTTAHQFNPLVDENVFTNDASLLLPATSVGEEYLVMSWPHRDPFLTGFVTIVAPGPDPVQITITASGRTQAGMNRLTGATILALPVGLEWQTTLQPGTLLNLSTRGPGAPDLTGTEIVASGPIVVFGGHQCANIPEPSVSFCDHLEQQLIPVDAWGRNYIIGAFAPRMDGDGQVIRVLASVDGTTLSTDPAMPEFDEAVLDRGEFIDLRVQRDLALTASEPVLVAQYMTGSMDTGGGDMGDPAMTLAVPINQWRRDYIFLTPQAYADDFVNVSAPTGVEVFIDGNPVTGFSPVGDSGYSVARVPVEDGPHTVSSDDFFGVIAYGRDLRVSYAYPGGLNLER